MNIFSVASPKRQTSLLLLPRTAFTFKPAFYMWVEKKNGKKKSIAELVRAKKETTQVGFIK